jgi:hypothetical protein
MAKSLHRRAVIRRQGARLYMAEVIPFPVRRVVSDEDIEIDLMTAVDAAIRDLRDISLRWGDEAARQQAEACRLMLEKAYDAAL